MLTAARTGAWAKSGGKPLPYDEELEYVELGSRAQIDCQTTMGSGARIYDLTFSYVGSSYFSTIQTGTVPPSFNASQRGFLFLGSVDQSVQYNAIFNPYRAYAQGNVSGFEGTNRIVIDTNDGSVSYNGTFIETTPRVVEKNWVPGNLYIGGGISYTYPERDASLGLRIFSCKITEADGSVTMDMIPVMKDGIATLYDKARDLVLVVHGITIPGRK